MEEKVFLEEKIIKQRALVIIYTISTDNYVSDKESNYSHGQLIRLQYML